VRAHRHACVNTRSYAAHTQHTRARPHPHDPTATRTSAHTPTFLTCQQTNTRTHGHTKTHKPHRRSRVHATYTRLDPLNDKWYELEREQPGGGRVYTRRGWIFPGRVENAAGRGKGSHENIALGREKEDRVTERAIDNRL
jgi:hypothetical protein